MRRLAARLVSMTTLLLAAVTVLPPSVLADGIAPGADVLASDRGAFATAVVLALLLAAGGLYGLWRVRRASLRSGQASMDASGDSE